MELKNGNLNLLSSCVQILRIYKAKEHAEVEFTVGYLPCYMIGKATDSFTYMAQKQLEFFVLKLFMPM